MDPLSHLFRRNFEVLRGVTLSLIMIAGACTATPARTPVIVDTDIGDDFDDCWALVTALKSPQLDVKLITTAYGQRDYRAKLIARFLMAAGRTDVPIGLGSAVDHKTGEHLKLWLADFKLSTYKGEIRKSAAQAIVDSINRSTKTITVVALGPMDTLAAAVKLDPGIAAKANLVGMLGSVHFGYGQKPGAIAEYNVKSDIPSAQKVLTAPWKSIAFAPLDTAGGVFIDETRFLKVQASSDPLVQALLSSYRAFIEAYVKAHGRDQLLKYGYPPPERISFSNPGYDVVGIHLADSARAETLNLETLTIKITNDGITQIAPDGRAVQVATSWKDKNRFLDHTVGVLTDSARNK